MTRGLELGLTRGSGCSVRPLWLRVPGARLHGWLVTPASDPPWPLVAMAHGSAAVKEMNLDIFAAAMCDAGIAALVLDHRGFGAAADRASTSTPRSSSSTIRRCSASGRAYRRPTISLGHLGHKPERRSRLAAGRPRTPHPGGGRPDYNDLRKRDDAPTPRSTVTRAAAPALGQGTVQH